MTYELIPPTEDFFSYQWYERSGSEDLYSMTRIDSTRRKLSELETKLSHRMDNEKYNPDVRSFLDRVGWLRSYIGIWQSRNDGIDRDAHEIYPHTGHIMPIWNERILGKRKEGNVLILLSSSSITWLNAVDKWVSEYTVTSSTTVSST